MVGVRFFGLSGQQTSERQWLARQSGKDLARHARNRLRALFRPPLYAHLANSRNFAAQLLPNPMNSAKSTLSALCLGAVLLCAPAASAGVRQTVVAGGQELPESVAAITFDGSTARLAFVGGGALDTPADGLSIHFDYTDADAIDNVRAAKRGREGETYNIMGQRVAKPQRGLYIIDGKKVVRK